MKLTPAERARLEADLAWFDREWPAIWRKRQAQQMTLPRGEEIRLAEEEEDDPCSLCGQHPHECQCADTLASD